MRVLISWSGDRSRHVALALRDWIPDVIQAVTPWMSDTDIHAGADWLAELGAELNQGSFGIICLTRERADAPWMMFEAGALAKSVDATRVCPYLIDMEPGDIPAGPLTIFQAKRANEAGTKDLVGSINNAIETDKGQLAPDRLARAFEARWPTLEAALRALPPEDAPAAPARTLEQKMDEVLQIARGLARHKDREQAIEALQHEMTRRSVLGPLLGGGGPTSEKLPPSLKAMLGQHAWNRKSGEEDQ